MKYLTFLLLAILVSCNSSGKKPLIGKTPFQQKMNSEFRDASKSPLSEKQRKHFKGLDFYPVDSSLIVTAKLTKTPDALTFRFPTTGERAPLYRSYGVLDFKIDTLNCKLTVYKNEEPDLETGYETYLFLPFKDKTSGTTSYKAGRYIQLFTTDEQKDGTITINFNEAYNPYCAYNTKYQCPLTPDDNYIDTEIKAGVMDFKK